MKRITLAFGCLALLLVVGRSAAEDKKSGVVVDKEKKTVTVDAKVAPRKLEHLKGEAYPSEVHKGLESLGLKPGKPARGAAMKEGAPDPKGEGPEVNVFIEVPDGAGGTKRLTLDKILMDPKTKKPAPKMTFIFTGSVMTAVDPNKPDVKKYGADLTGSLITLFPVTDEIVLQTGWTMK